jgi:hypothetical protein
MNKKERKRFTNTEETRMKRKTKVRKGVKNETG